jgi:hypothetical protein
VFIRGPVDVYGAAACANLTIESPYGILQNGNYYSQTLQVNGGITNNGIIKDNTYGYLYINITGNIVHVGNEWSNYESNINGTENQDIGIKENKTIAKVILHANITGTGH